MSAGARASLFPVIEGADMASGARLASTTLKQPSFSLVSLVIRLG